MKKYLLYLISFFLCQNVYCMDVNALSDVLLIVNFNHPYYQNIEFIKKLYGPFFKKIVFYGEQEYPGVTAVVTQKGFYISDVIVDAFTKNPGFSGYLFLEDDCVLNMWHCLQLDKNKIWILPGFTNDPNHVEYNHKFHIANYITMENAMDWWFHRDDWGLVPAGKAFEKIPVEDQKIAEDNFGKGNLIGTAVDMFYIPGRFREKVIEIVPHFPTTFLEITIPTMISCLDHKSNWEQRVSVLWLGYAYNTPWPDRYTCVHPYKLSHLPFREYIVQVYKQFFPQINF